MLVVLVAFFWAQAWGYTARSGRFMARSSIASQTSLIASRPRLALGNLGMESSPNSISLQGGGSRGLVSREKPLIGRLMRKVAMGLAAVMLAFVRGVKNAAADTGSAIKGWDLYGRVPNDDFLFSTYALTDPNLLKRSFVETIVQELPDVLGNFKRRKRINELMSIVSGLGYFALTMAAVGLLYKTAMAANLRRSQTEEEMGRGFSASAISKKAARKGKAIDGMEDGWVDMEEDDDDEPPPPPPKKKK